MNGTTKLTSPDQFDGSLPVCSPVTGCPDSGKYGDAITIDGSEDFRKKTRLCLEAISKTATGAKMLKAIESGGKAVVIKETSGGNGIDADSYDAERKADGTPGAGCNSTVHYNPTKTQIGDGSEGWMKRPPCIGLGHELVHAYHNSRGTNDFTQMGEQMAVGLDVYESETVSENKLRDEWKPKQPKRTQY